MKEIDEHDYERGKEARENFFAYLGYAIVAIVLLVIEIMVTEWWTIILGPITIFLTVLIAKNRSVIRGFLGLK